MRIKLDIQSVAIKQLESAIWMFAYDYDEVAVHTIAGAAFELYSRRLKLSTFQDDMKKFVKPEKSKEFIDLWNRPYNYFKHGAFKFEDIEYIEYDEEVVEILIYLAAEANLAGPEEYRLASAQTFKIYFLLKRPEYFEVIDSRKQVSEAMATFGVTPMDVGNKTTLQLWLKTNGSRFVSGNDSPFRNVKPE